MKKILSIVLVLVIVLSLSACGAEAVTEVGTWELTNVFLRTISQGMLNTSEHTTITIYSDNTYVMTNVHCVTYSSDGGETFNPVSYTNSIVYGTYETVEVSEELGETTIKIASVTRVVNGDCDTAVSNTDADKEAMAACEAIGTELILGADHKLSATVSVTNTMKIGKPEE